MLPMPESLFARAADINRKPRRMGITMRKINDCLIAVTALEHDCRLLHSDRNLLPIDEHCGLKAISC